MRLEHRAWHLPQPPWGAAALLSSGSCGLTEATWNPGYTVLLITPYPQLLASQSLM